MIIKNKGLYNEVKVDKFIALFEDIDDNKINFKYKEKNAKEAIENIYDSNTINFLNNENLVNINNINDIKNESEEDDSINEEDQSIDNTSQKELIKNEDAYNDTIKLLGNLDLGKTIFKNYEIGKKIIKYYSENSFKK